VSESNKRRTSYPLRLAASLKHRAQFLANQDRVSLNHFISLAVAERISRLEVAGKKDFPSKPPAAPVNNVMRDRRPP
jgi:hypothetical protein